MDNTIETTEKYTTYTYDYRSYASKPDDFSSSIDLIDVDKAETRKTCWLDDFGWI